MKEKRLYPIRIRFWVCVLLINPICSWVIFGFSNGLPIIIRLSCTIGTYWLLVAWPIAEEHLYRKMGETMYKDN